MKRPICCDPGCFAVPTWWQGRNDWDDYALWCAKHLPKLSVHGFRACDDTLGEHLWGTLRAQWRSGRVVDGGDGARMNESKKEAHMSTTGAHGSDRSAEVHLAAIGAVLGVDDPASMVECIEGIVAQRDDLAARVPWDESLARHHLDARPDESTSDAAERVVVRVRQAERDAAFADKRADAHRKEIGRLTTKVAALQAELDTAVERADRYRHVASRWGGRALQWGKERKEASAALREQVSRLRRDACAEMVKGSEYAQGCVAAFGAVLDLLGPASVTGGAPPEGWADATTVMRAHGFPGVRQAVDHLASDEPEPPYEPRVGDLATWTETHTKRVEALLPGGKVRLRDDPNEHAVTVSASVLRPAGAGGAS